MPKVTFVITKWGRHYEDKFEYSEVLEVLPLSGTQCYTLKTRNLAVVNTAKELDLLANNIKRVTGNKFYQWVQEVLEDRKELVQELVTWGGKILGQMVYLNLINEPEAGDFNFYLLNYLNSPIAQLTTYLIPNTEIEVVLPFSAISCSNEGWNHLFHVAMHEFTKTEPYNFEWFVRLVSAMQVLGKLKEEINCGNLRFRN